VIVAAPARRLATLRLLTGAFALTYLAFQLPILLDQSRLPVDRWEPPGVLGPLGSPPAVGLVHLGLGLTLLAGVGYLIGWRYRVSGPAFAVGLLAVLTYRNAWGHVFHTDNLLVLHVLIIGLAPAAAAWSLDARGSPEPPGDVRFGWPVRLAALATVLTYVVTGIAKLRYAGLDWLGGDTLLHQIAFDNARKKVLGDTYSPLATALAGHPALFRPLGPFTLVVELAAPVALLGRRWAAWWSGAAWLFHVGILGLMWISFPYPLSFVAFAPFFRCERFVEAVLGLRPVRRLVST
jgi:hypothetical protein